LANGELNIRDDAYVSDNYYAFRIGEGGSAAGASYGKVRIEGGALVVKMSASLPALPNIFGLAVGYGGNTDGFAGVYNRGVLEVAGGVISNNFSAASDFTVGYGNAEGEVVQTGGKVLHNNSRHVRIGYYGGIGAYRMSGGEFRTSTAVSLGSEGGKGTLEMMPGDGVFNAAALSLNGADSSLVFKIGADGSCSKVNLTGALMVADGAKLVIDATEYTGAQRIRLLDCGSMSGVFADADITLLSRQTAHVFQSGSGIELRPKNGLIFSVR
jgi:hypothetical protein